MLTCRYCGSHRLETVGGDYGNPFDRRKEKTICLDCGRTVATEPDLADLFQSVICIEIEMTAEGGGLVRKAKAKFPFEDGAYDLSRLAYPLCRYKRLKISKDTADLGGLVRKARAEFAFQDGEYDLSRLEYPLCRYKRLKISKGTVDLGGEIFVSITDVPYETTRQYTAYAPDKQPVAETVKIRIYSDIK